MTWLEDDPERDIFDREDEPRRRRRPPAEYRFIDWSPPEPPKPIEEMAPEELSAWLASIGPALESHMGGAKAAYRDRRRDLAQAVLWFGRLNARARHAHRIFSVHCPDPTARCALLEVFPRKSTSSPTGEVLLLVAASRRGAAKFCFAANPGVDGLSENAGRSLMIGCKHGYGSWPLTYPAFIRRSGPAPRRRITDLERDPAVIATFAMFDSVLWARTP